MTEGKHTNGGSYPGATVFIVMGTLLAISLSMNAVFYTLLNWNLIPDH